MRSVHAGWIPCSIDQQRRLCWLATTQTHRTHRCFRSPTSGNTCIQPNLSERTVWSVAGYSAWRSRMLPGTEYCGVRRGDDQLLKSIAVFRSRSDEFVHDWFVAD